MSGTRFEYEVVTSNGCGIHGRRDRLNDAMRLAADLAEKSPIFAPYELQQVAHVPGGGKRYWLRHGRKWGLVTRYEDIDERRPDWRWPPADDAPLSEGRR